MALGGRIDTPKRAKPPNPPLRIESRIGIMAPPAAVWEIVADISNWPSWNPLYPAAQGELRIGAPLSMTIALPGEPHRQAEPKIMDWIPEEQILWSDLAWGGWVKSVRYIEIEQVDKAACILSNGELFQGFISEYFGNRHRRALKNGFTAMSEAVKLQAERLWQDKARGAK